jgi:SEC-C motif-containing protein
MQGICKLCRQQKELQYSHIVPAFAVRWLKATSLTGYLKSLKSKVHLQDTKRVYLLCSDCEQLLARDEKAFCEQIFIPYHEQNQSNFKYGPWLKRFIVGLHWKVLVTREEQYPQHAEAEFTKAEQEWCQFLLGQSASAGNAEFHLFLADVIEDATDELPPKINWYLARGFDLTPIYSDSGMAGVYAKVTKAMTFSYLTDKGAEEKLDGTLVMDEGVISTGQTISGKLGPLILERAKAIERFPKTISRRQHAKLLDRARKEPEKILATESHRIFEADMALKERMRERLMKKEAKRRMKGRDRNSPCPCGSGMKYKKCHGEK